MWFRRRATVAARFATTGRDRSIETLTSFDQQLSVNNCDARLLCVRMFVCARASHICVMSYVRAYVRTGPIDVFHARTVCVHTYQVIRIQLSVHLQLYNLSKCLNLRGTTMNDIMNYVTFKIVNAVVYAYTNAYV